MMGLTCTFHWGFHLIKTKDATYFIKKRKINPDILLMQMGQEYQVRISLFLMQKSNLNYNWAPDLHESKLYVSLLTACSFILIGTALTWNGLG